MEKMHIDINIICVPVLSPHKPTKTPSNLNYFFRLQHKQFCPSDILSLKSICPQGIASDHAVSSFLVLLLRYLGPCTLELFQGKYHIHP